MISDNHIEAIVEKKVKEILDGILQQQRETAPDNPNKTQKPSIEPAFDLSRYISIAEDKTFQRKFRKLGDQAPELLVEFIETHEWATIGRAIELAEFLIQKAEAVGE